MHLMFVSLISQKGGTGKTTLAIHLAAILAHSGSKTLLIDADPQASAMAWLACRTQSGHAPIANLTILANSNGSITDQLPQLAASYDYVVIDGPPRGDRIARDVLLASDIVLIPTRLSGFDVWAGDSITRTIEELKPIQQMASKRPLDWFFVVNQKNPRTTAGKIILKALEGGESAVLDSHVCERTGFVEATSQGLTVFETSAADAKAVRELEALAHEVRTLMTNREQRRAA